MIAAATVLTALAAVLLVSETPSRRADLAKARIGAAIASLVALAAAVVFVRALGLAEGLLVFLFALTLAASLVPLVVRAAPRLALGVFAVTTLVAVAIGAMS